MKTNKKAIVCFLAVVMLLVVSVASASTYTEKTILNNTVDIEKQITIKKVNVDTAELYGNVRERYKVHWGWEHRPFLNVTVIAIRVKRIFIPWNPYLFGQIEATDITDENGHFNLYVPAGRYALLTHKEGYTAYFPAGCWHYPLFWQHWNSPKEPIWVEGWFSVECESDDYKHYTFTLWKEKYKPPMNQPVNTFQQLLINLGK